MLPRAFIVLLAALALGACETAPRKIAWTPHEGPAAGAYPAEHWAKSADPEAMGWSPEGLEEARAFSREIGTTALMVIDGGVVVDAWGGINVKSNLHSVRKSLLSALIGIAVDEGRIDLSATMEELGIDDNEPSLTATEKQATVGDLITARSGVYHAALYESPEMTASKPPRGSHEPGDFWHYNNWDFNALGTIYEQQTGERIFESFDNRIAEPLQMEDYEISDGEYYSGEQSIHAAYPFRMTARDLARFALLYLREGRWRDRQIVSAGWVEESTVAHSVVGPDFGYGYMWWTGRGSGPFPNVVLAEDAYIASGWNRQIAMVFPYIDLIVVHRVNTDRYRTAPPPHQVGRLLWMILNAGGVNGIGPDPGIDAAPGQQLYEADLRATLTGAKATGESRRGIPWRVAFGADGTLSGVAGTSAEHTDTGSWRIERGRACRTWSKWAGARESCSTLFKDGAVLYSYDETGTLRGTMTLVAPGDDDRGKTES